MQAYTDEHPLFVVTVVEIVIVVVVWVKLVDVVALHNPHNLGQ